MLQKNNILPALLCLFFSSCFAVNKATAQKDIIKLAGSSISPAPASFPYPVYDTIKITFLGDLMQHQPQISSAQRLCREDGFNYSHTFKYVRDKLISSNISVANMEFTVGESPYFGYPCFKAPYAIADAAFSNGINLFLTANNHICDQGLSGIKKTLSYYSIKGYPHTGSCNKEDEKPYKPHFRVINGIKIAFINFTYGTNGLPVKEPYSVNYMDSAKVVEAIYNAKKINPDIIIAVPHWGIEYEMKANKKQKAWAKMLFENGVDIIVGGHPHVPQNYSITYNGNDRGKCKAVFYSLGNFVSNQSNPPATRIAMEVSFTVIKERFSGHTSIMYPEWEYLWCFRPNEFEKGYCVAPIEKVIDGSIKPDKSVPKHVWQPAVEKMKNSYKDFLNLYK